MSIYMSGGILAYCVTLALVLGACFGSFLHCAAWRVAHREPWWKGRSHCPACGHTLGAPDLVPVFSWLALGGKCRHCGAKIPARYLAAELTFAALTAACLLRFDLSVLCLRNWVFLGCLFCLSLVDLEIMEIPDELLVTAAVTWLLCLPGTGLTLRQALIHLGAGLGVGAGMLLLSLAMDAILKRDSMGGGDIKLFGVVGLYLGPVSTLFALMFSALVGLVFQALRRRMGDGGEQFPFGPSIAAAAAGMLLFGQPLSDWYLAVLGL